MLLHPHHYSTRGVVPCNPGYSAAAWRAQAMLCCAVLCVTFCKETPACFRILSPIASAWAAKASWLSSRARFFSRLNAWFKHQNSEQPMRRRLVVQHSVMVWLGWVSTSEQETNTSGQETGLRISWYTKSGDECPFGCYVCRYISSRNATLLHV